MPLAPPSPSRALVATVAVAALAAAACNKSPADSATTTSAAASAAPAADAPSIHILEVNRLDGTKESLSTYAGKVLLVVNVASKCGFTPQYEPLQAIYAKYKDKGFSVLGFPSNDFGGQEPGSSSEIAAFCDAKYGVTFPLFEKVKTKGDDASPVYALLGAAKGPPKWNFHKYLVDKSGRVVAAWPSAVRPDSPEITEAIEAQLAAPAK